MLLACEDSICPKPTKEAPERLLQPRQNPKITYAQTKAPATIEYPNHRLAAALQCCLSLHGTTLRGLRAHSASIDRTALQSRQQG
jgi:hypothetical protein